VIAIPGHTAGSIGLLDEKSGLLFTGDSILKGQVWMHLQGSASLSTYLESLRNVYALRSKFEYLLPNHAESPISVLVLKELISGAEDILTGRRTGFFIILLQVMAYHATLTLVVFCITPRIFK
jgi:hydroxyacylglutathione hydrolase